MRSREPRKIPVKSGERTFQWQRREGWICSFATYKVTKVRRATAATSYPSSFWNRHFSFSLSTPIRGIHHPTHSNIHLLHDTCEDAAVSNDILADGNYRAELIFRRLNGTISQLCGPSVVSTGTACTLFPLEITGDDR